MRFGVALFALATATAAASPDPKRKPLKRYTIDLDKEPEQRFTEVINDHKAYIKVVLALLDKMFDKDSAQALLNATVVPDEYRREMQGIADLVGGTYEQALMANMFYELSGVKSDYQSDLPSEWRNVMTESCTGIVVQNSNGSIFHGRNQDYPPPFAPLQFDGIFTKGGKVLYEATTFAGTNGVGGTCMVPGEWSVSLDARGAFAPGLDDAKKAASSGAWLFPFLSREACKRGGDFKTAVDFMSSQPMIMPGYFIVAGKQSGEGVVITRNSTAEGTDHFYIADGYPKGAKPWFVVETNYDHWKAAPKSDDRRDSAIRLISAIGADNIDLDALWGVLSDPGKGTGTRGVYNQATIHTELICPGTGEYHTYMRHDIV